MSDLKSLRSKAVGSVNNTDVPFTKKELEFLLDMIAKSNFEGKDVQIVYETAVKLQQKLIIKN